MFVSLLFIVLAVAAGCDSSQKERVLSSEEFEKVYGDILFLGELHRGHPELMRNAMDSLLTANSLDTAVLFRTATLYAERKYSAAELHDALLGRFEALARKDSAARAEKGSAHPVTRDVEEEE